MYSSVKTSYCRKNFRLLKVLFRSNVARIFLALSLLLNLGFELFSPTSMVLAQSVPDTLTPQLQVQQHGTASGATDSNQNLNLVFSLKVQNQAALDQFLQDLYNPSSSNYKHYLTPQEFTDRFISSTDRAQVVSFLQSKGLTVKDSGLGSVIDVSTTVGKAEQAFSIRINNYRDSKGRVFYSNNLTPALPTSVANRINGIFGLDNALQAQSFVEHGPNDSSTPSTVNLNSASGCTTVSYAHNPNQFATAYNFNSLYTNGDKGQGQTVALVEYDDYKDSDVSTYQSCFSSSVSVSRVSIDGGVSSIGSGEDEVDLDIDVVLGMDPSLSSLLVYESPNNLYYGLDQFQDIANKDVAKTVSYSWGICENYLVNASGGTSFLNSENTVFQQLATQGQSVFASSGDTGSQGCERTNSSTVLSTSDPAVQPYVTGVGGTKLTLTSGDARSSEVVWNEYSVSGGAGGGGLSQYWSRPSWQVGTGTSNSYSNGKRENPDVAADADPYTGYVVYYEGSYHDIGGTSAAAPLWAAATALTNQYLTSLNYSTVGFANSTIYRIFNSPNSSSVFYDVTSGDNCYYTSCGTPDSGTAIYPASTGYDQATGVGVLNAYQFAVNAIPESLSTSTSSLQFSGTYGGSNPSNQSISLSASSNTSVITWTSSVSYGSGASNWASITSSGTVSGGSSSSVSVGAAISSLSAGTYTATVKFTDSSYITDSVSVPLTLTVQKASTSTALASSVNPSVYGQSVIFTATITPSGSGTPTGSVIFTDTTTSTTLGTGTLSSGKATVSVSNLSVTSHLITAKYVGDTNYSSSTASSSLSQTVNKDTTVTNLNISPTTPYTGQTVYLTATVSVSLPGAGMPTGTLTFKDGSSPLITTSLSSGMAYYNTTSLGVGQHTLSAVYNGDTNDNSSTSSQTNITTNLNSANLALNFGPNPSVYGQSVTFTATISPASGNMTPTSSVIFTDTTTNTTIGTGTLSNGVATVVTNSLSVGSHTISANYSGDSNFGKSNFTSSTPLVVNQASTTTSLSASPLTLTLGQTVYFTATVSVTSPGSGTPSGIVTFTSGGTVLGTGMLSNGVAAFNTSSLSAGQNNITVTYGGDTNNAGSTSAQVTVNISKYSADIALSFAPNPSVYGQTVIFTATVSSTNGGGTPTGSVVFTDSTTNTQIGSGTLVNGATSVSTNSLSVGTHSIILSYSGDSNFGSQTVGSLNHPVVNQDTTATNLAVSNSTVSVGQSVTFTATVSVTAPGAGTPSGTITFTDGISTLGTATLNNGKATYTTSSLGAGLHIVTASYGGDTNDLTSISSQVSVTVNTVGTNLTLTSAPNPSIVGQSVTLTATVAPASGNGTPSGIITFTDNISGTLGTATLTNGVATYTTSSLTQASHTITASYGGDNNYSNSSNSISQTVNPILSTSLALASAPNPSVYGQQVSITATVSSSSGTPTGLVIFTDTTTNTNLGTATLSNGSAFITVSNLSVTTHNITASYSGNSSYYGSVATAPVSQTVNQDSTTTNLNASSISVSFGQSVYFTATVSIVAPGVGTPSGVVTFTDGNTPLGTGTLSNGVASFNTNALGIGSHTITATYVGDANSASSTSSQLTVDVGKYATSLVLTSAPNPAVLGESVTFTGTVSGINGTPTGSVIFTDTTTNTQLGTVALSNGVASVSTNSLSVTSHNITASYGGDNNYATSITTNPVTQIVNKDSTATNLVASSTTITFGQSIIFTASVSVPAPGVSTPSGTVTFTDGIITLGTGIISNGVVSYTTSSLGVGTHDVTAVYSGDGNNSSSTSSKVTVTVNSNFAGTNLNLTSTPNPSVFGQSVTFTATVTPVFGNGTPTGSVIFTDTTTNASLGTVALNKGIASIAISTLSVTSHNIAASYAGDSNYSGSAATNPVTQMVNKDDTSISLNASTTSITVGQTVNFTATVSITAPGVGSPSGNVSFMDGNNTLATATISNGAATFSASNLSTGGHTITAVYSGDSNSKSATSSSIVVTANSVVKVDTITTLTSSSTTIKPGDNVSFTAKVTSANGTPSGTITFLDGDTVIANYFVLTNGATTVNVNSLTLGTHSITAIYNGNDSYNTSTSNMATVLVTNTVTTTPITPTIVLASSATVITQGQNINFTTTLSSPSGIPTGNVVFFDGTVQMGSAISLNSGVASYSTSSLSVGSHTIKVIYSGSSSFNSVSSASLTVTVNSSTTSGGNGGNTYTYYVPFVANNADSFTTFLAFQNVGSAAANVSVQYYDASGNAVSSSLATINCSPVPLNGECLPNNPLATGGKGTAIISSDQLLNVVVTEATPYGGSAYIVSSGSNSSLIAPFALNNAFGDFTTQLNIFNIGDTATTANITFYGTIGNSSTTTSSTTSITIAAHTTANLSQSSLANGFSGWAQITGSSNSLVAQVLEQSPSQHFVAIANAAFMSSSTLYAPAIFNNGYGGFYTGENIINPNDSPVIVNITYYNKDTNEQTAVTPFVLQPHASQSIFQAATSGTGLPTGGLTNGFVGAAIITSSGGGVVMSVNENGGSTSTGNSRSGVYLAAANGANKVGLPVVSNGGFTYITGDTIFNTSNKTVSGTLTYYNADGSQVPNSSQSFTIPAFGSAAFYQGSGNLPSNFYGTAVITEANGDATNALIVTTNAQNSALFYTYTEPNS